MQERAKVLVFEIWKLLVRIPKLVSLGLGLGLVSEMVQLCMVALFHNVCGFD